MASGEVCTFGSGVNGRLGHGTEEDSLIPMVVAELHLLQCSNVDTRYGSFARPSETTTIQHTLVLLVNSMALHLVLTFPTPLLDEPGPS